MENINEVWTFDDTFQVWLWGDDQNGCGLYRLEEGGWMGRVMANGKNVKHSGPWYDFEDAKVEIVEEFKEIK